MTQVACKRPQRRRRGIVLILVTVVIVMVTLAGLSFVLTLATEHKAIALHGDELRLQQLLESGVELMGTFAEQSPEIQAAAGGADNNPGLFRGALVASDETAGRHGRVTLASPHWDNDEIIGIRYGWEDESNRLNLAVLPEWERRSPGSAERALMNLPGMTESAAAKIMDWIDADDASRPGGAERQQYADLRLPYAPRNGCPACLEELLLIRDVRRDLLLGNDLNLDYQLSARETGGRTERIGSGPTGTPPPWAALLTLHSAERNLNPRGQPRVDLNEPDLRRLFTRLSAVIDPAWAEFVVLYRQYGPSGVAASPGGKTTGSPTAEEVAAKLDFQHPPLCRIESILDLVGATIVLSNPATRQSRVIESPFAADRAAMRNYLPALLDETAVVPAAMIPGRVNVNAASRTVLRCVPGMDDRLVEAILSSRRAGVEDSGRQHATWLLTEGLVELPQMKALLPYLNCGGHVYRAQIIGYFEEGGPTARAEVVLDAAVRPPRPVSWTDLRPRGRGFSREEL